MKRQTLLPHRSKAGSISHGFKTRVGAAELAVTGVGVTGVGVTGVGVTGVAVTGVGVTGVGVTGVAVTGVGLTGDVVVGIPPVWCEACSMLGVTIACASVNCCSRTAGCT